MSLLGNTAAAVNFELQNAPADWQRRFDTASKQKSSGKQKMIIGIAASAGGVLIGTLAANSCLNSSIFDSCAGESNAALFGGLVSAGGGGVFLWGLIQWIDANGELDRLDAQRPQTGAVLLPLGEHQAVRLSAGQRTSASFALSW